MNIYTRGQYERTLYPEILYTTSKNIFQGRNQWNINSMTPIPVMADAI